MSTARANQHLAALRRRIEAGSLESVSDLWGGAGVVIRTASISPPSEGGFYPLPRCIVTDFAKELTWVFGELASVMRMADAPDREFFFGDVADAVDAYLREERPAELQPLLLAAIRGAAHFLARGNE